MAKPNSQSHANLLREMARETNKSSRQSGNSQASPSPQSTISDFDPENEAIMSTRQLDNNLRHSPALRASAKKYNRFSRQSRPEVPPPSDPDYAINTSAIGRAFPDFSQGGTSSDEGSMSIEIGRGAKKASGGPATNPERFTEYSSVARLDLDEDSLDLAAPMVGDYIVTGTPPLRPHQPSKKVIHNSRGSAQFDVQTRRASGLRKEIVEISPPLAKTKDYGSGESGRGSGDHGRTLAAFHARARDEVNMSHINEERPPTIDLTIRNTRFGSVKSHQNLLTGAALPTKFSSSQGFMTNSSSPRKTKSHKTSNSNQGTQQSFLLPDMPNMSELVSGVFENGTPIFSRHGRSRPSRFVKGLGHAKVDVIPIPEDEQAIFLSLKLLQDKIAVLEKNQAENEGLINDLEQKNQNLESERFLQRRRSSHRSDSALGNSESDGEGRKLTIEKNRLESSIRTLQSQLDASGRKATTAETILRTITQERDSAVSQLSVAYVTIRQLQAENEGLTEENELLKRSASQLPDGHDNRIKKADQIADDSGRQKKATPTSNPQESHNKASRSAEHLNRQADAPMAHKKKDEDMFDLTPRPEAFINTSHKASQQSREERLEDSESSSYEVPRANSKGKLAFKTPSVGLNLAQHEDSTQDLTYLSFLDSNEVAKLRRTLEHERVERKQRQSVKSQSVRGETATNVQIGPDEQTRKNEPPLPKNSSMKDLASRTVKENDASIHPMGRSEYDRRHSENSIQSMRSRRRGRNTDNMTSAFIVPDITIRPPTTATEEPPKLSKKNEVDLEGLAHHNDKNCMVCERNPDHDGPQCYTIKVSKPVPVSERMPPASLYEDEPTVRPSQAPGVALATVMKALQDEIVHLKIQLAKDQKRYNSHDAALSKRKRKSVFGKIESLLQAIDIKSDQIYALYDVLEGQKQDGCEISEHEVEITLQSVGIDAASLHLRGGGVEEGEELKVKANERHPWDLSSDDEDEKELPWEGVESTIETIKSVFGRSNRRSAAA